MLDGVLVPPVHADGGEPRLAHGGQELHVHAVGAEAVEHQEGRWADSCSHTWCLTLQRGDITNRCVLVDLESQGGAFWKAHGLKLTLFPVLLKISKCVTLRGPTIAAESFGEFFFLSRRLWQ